MKLRGLSYLFAVSLLSSCAANTSSNTANDSEHAVITGQSATAALTEPMAVKPMSFGQLFSCGNRMKALQQDLAKHNDHNKEMQQAKNQLVVIGNVLEQDRDSVDVHNSKHIEAYNGRLMQHKENINKFNAKVVTFNQELTRFKIKRNEINDQCVQRPYLVSDLKRLPADLQVAIQQYSAITEIPITIEQAIDDYSEQPQSVRK